MAELEVLCALRPGETVSLHDNNKPAVIWHHRSWTTALHRMYFQESRQKVVAWVEKMVQFIKQEVWSQYQFAANFDFFQKASSKNNMSRLVLKLKRVISGIQNLQYTYRKDFWCIEQLQKCIRPGL